MSVPKYSICMCNYNMAATLEPALRSILDQLDERFEVVIVDDGSSDNSVEVIKSLQQQYKNLRLVPLKRDGERQLGFTRNASIKEAQGDYVLLHLDCDDITAPHIKDFVNVFHQIESAVGKDILLSGRPIQMGRKDFLLAQGPYRNIHRGEDRDMWGRFAVNDAIYFLTHKGFKTVLPKTAGDRLYRAVYYTFDHLRNDFRGDVDMKKFFYYEVFVQKFGLKTKLVRMMVMLPAYISGKLKGPLPAAKTMENYEEFAKYALENGGTFTEILQKNDASPDWSQLSPTAKSIF